MDIDNRNKLGIIDDKVYNYYENIYKQLFERYLLSKIDLVKYDNLIHTSELGFGLVGKTIEMKYNLNEYLNLKYFWILNNFNIEKLSIEDFEMLKSDNLEDKLELIKRTYKDIILTNYHGGKYIDKKYKINHSNYDVLNNFSNNDELVLAIYYGSNTKKYGTNEDYLLNYNEKKEFLNSISNELKIEFKTKLDLNIKVIYEKI